MGSKRVGLKAFPLFQVPQITCYDVVIDRFWRLTGVILFHIGPLGSGYLLWINVGLERLRRIILWVEEASEIQIGAAPTKIMHMAETQKALEVTVDASLFLGFSNCNL